MRSANHLIESERRWGIAQSKSWVSSSSSRVEMTEVVEVENVQTCCEQSRNMQFVEAKDELRCVVACRSCDALRPSGRRVVWS